ncbi:MAG: hypothetical protein ACYSW0_19975 [Planctomycetota bacterium]|jgi:hypothetical protein
MPWVQFGKIDGVEVVLGFGSPGIDPEATKKKVMAELEGSVEFAEYRKTAMKVSKQIETVTKRRAEAEGAIKRAGNGQGRHVLKKRKSEKIDTYQKCNKEIQRYHGILEQSLSALEAKKLELIDSCVVLLSGGGYEQVGEDTYKTLFDAHKTLRPRQYVTRDGSVIDDLRGTKYLVKTDGMWVSVKISKFGEALPDGAKLQNQLTADDRTEIMDQAKARWIAGLDDGERQKLLAKELDEASMQAALRRSAFELSDHKDPTGAAKKWLQAQQAKIREVYNVAG